MERTLICETPKKVGEKIKIYGFVHVVRAHGKIAFADKNNPWVAIVKENTIIQNFSVEEKPVWVSWLQGKKKTNMKLSLINIIS